MNIQWFFLNLWQVFFVSCTSAFEWGSKKSLTRNHRFQQVPQITPCEKVFQSSYPAGNEANLKENNCVFCPSNCRNAVRMKRTGNAWNRPSLPSWTCSAAWSAFTASTPRGAGLGKHPQSLPAFPQLAGREINPLFLLENLDISFSRHVLLPVFFVDGAAAQNLHAPLVRIMWIFDSFPAKAVHGAYLELA